MLSGESAERDKNPSDKADRSSGEVSTSPKPRPRRITSWRKWFFRLLLATVIPALFLILLEVGLWVCGFGYPTDFFVKIDDRDAYTTNRYFGWRFFPPAIARVPVVCEMAAEKPQGAYRIFVLGGSAARGIPDKAFGFGRMLEAMLRERYPRTKFDVINTAMTAINSHVVLPIARDCAAHQPDLFVVYMGNNEVVGPYGNGTIFGDFSGRLSVIRAGIHVKSTRIGQLTARVFGRHEDAAKWRGMQMFLKQRVRADDPEMESVYEHFRANLSDICDVARRSGAKVILSTVPVNLKDCPPFAAMHRRDIEEPQAKQWAEFHNAGIALAEAGKHAEATKAFDSALRLDDSHAELHFRLAGSLFELGRFDEAREHFVSARNFDVLRFRADSRVNRIIREVAAEYDRQGVHLVDAEQAFARSDRTQRQIPGRELFYEHVHLTPEGNYLLAKVSFEQIVLVLDDSIRKGAEAPAPPPADRCFELIALTDWDRYQAQMMISDMLRKAPFTNQIAAAGRYERRKKLLAALRTAATSPDVRNSARKWYAAALARRSDDLQLHLKFAQLLKGQGDYQAAVQQWRYLLNRFPNAAQWHLKLAELLQDSRRFPDAIVEFREAMRLDRFLADNAYAGIGISLARQDKRTEAETVLRDALAANPKLPITNTSLGVVLFEQGKHAEALSHFHRALEIDPDLAAPHHNLAIAHAKRDSLSEAITHYRKYLQIVPDEVAARYNFAFLLAETGQISESVTEYREVLAQEPDHVGTLRSLAEILATCRNSQFRDGPQAVKIIGRALLIAGSENPELLRILGMAQAEAGQFDKAIAAAERALLHAKIWDRRGLISEIQSELSLYRQGKPCRNPGD